MAFGPVQILVVGFDHPEFKGKIRAELERLRDNDVVRLIDLLVVRKDDDGNIERLQQSDLSQEELEAQQMAAAPPPVAPSGGPTDLAAKLTELKGLMDQGVLTQEEFAAAKQKLLAG